MYRLPFKCVTHPIRPERVWLHTAWQMNIATGMVSYCPPMHTYRQKEVQSCLCVQTMVMHATTSALILLQHEPRQIKRHRHTGLAGIQYEPVTNLVIHGQWLNKRCQRAARGKHLTDFGLVSRFCIAFSPSCLLGCKETCTNPQWLAILMLM